MIFTQVCFGISRSVFLIPEEMTRDSTVELYMGIDTKNPVSPSTIWGRREQRNEHQRERRGLRKS